MFVCESSCCSLWDFQHLTQSVWHGVCVTAADTHWIFISLISIQALCVLLLNLSWNWVMEKWLFSLFVCHCACANLLCVCVCVCGDQDSWWHHSLFNKHKSGWIKRSQHKRLRSERDWFVDGRMVGVCFRVPGVSEEVLEILEDFSGQSVQWSLRGSRGTGGQNTL